MTVALVLCASLPAQAGIYRWVDADGTVRYSDTPPSGAQATRVQPYTRAPVRNRELPQNADADPEADASHGNAAKTPKPADKPSQPTPPALDPAVRAENCRKATDQLGFLERTPAVRILYETDDGQTTRMTPEARDARMDKLRALADRFCD